MPFGFRFSFTFRMGGGEPRPRSDDVTQQVPTDASETHRGGKRLSSTAPITARQARKQREREHLADEESLHLLEAATAANSDRARDLDRKSLAVLMQATKQREQERRGTDTPPKDWRYPIIHRLKGVNSTLLSYSPSFTSPSRVVSKSTTPKSRSEFEECLDDTAMASNATKAGAEETAWDSLRANLEAAGWSASSIEDVTNTQSGRRKRLVNSVYGWFDKLEERDAHDKRKRQDQNPTESTGSPVPSGSPERAQSPPRNGRPNKKQQDRKDISARDRLRLPHVAMGFTTEESQEDEALGDGDGDDDDDDEEWVLLEALGGGVRKLT